MLGGESHGLEVGYAREISLASDESADDVLVVRHASKGRSLADVNMAVRAGEVLGLYGTMGAGHTLLGECLYGIKRLDSGEIIFDGDRLCQIKPHSVKNRGIAYVTADRAISLFLDCEVYKNISVVWLKELLDVPLNERREIALAEDIMAKLKVKARSSLELLSNLSGGNQQKVSLARWLVRPIRLLILNEPTRGMDVSAKEEVMKIVKRLRDEGVAILLISSEPETVLANSDRILVFSKGRVAAEFANRIVRKEDLMRCA
jgi:ribose transport system ATP-binding protein